MKFPIALVAMASLALALPKNTKGSTPSQPKDAKSKSEAGGSSGTASGPGINLARDAETLKQFAQKITQDPTGALKTWQGNDPCNWEGIKCAIRPDNNQNSVASFDINQFGLVGDYSLAGLIDKLTDISIFHANTNNFKEPIPDLSGLKYLFELDLSNNKLSGAFPQSILSASQLTFLDLRFNELEGAIPSGIYNLDLDVLFLNNNKFTGPIDANAGNTAAIYLTYANNQFTGPIPESLSKAKNLKEVLFLGNPGITGAVPESLCAKKGLDVLDVSATGITAPLGPACLKALESGVLRVYETKIPNLPQGAGGPIPENPPAEGGNGDQDAPKEKKKKGGKKGDGKKKKKHEVTKRALLPL